MKISEYIVNLLSRDIDFNKIMEDYNATVADIRDTFYNGKTKITNLNLEYFQSYTYELVYGNLITGIQFMKEDKPYYMMISADSFYEPPKQIAVGTTDGENIHMIMGNVPDTSVVEIVSFPKEKANQKSSENISKGYRKTIHFANDNDMELMERDKKCLEYGLEATNVFCSIIRESEAKRKELSL